MFGCLRTRKQPIIALYFESENELKFYKLEGRTLCSSSRVLKCQHFIGDFNQVKLTTPFIASDLVSLNSIS